MRSVRKMVFGFAVAACALSVLSAPAFAKHPKKEKEKHVFGKFVSSLTGPTKGHGTLARMSLGIYNFTGEEKLNSKGEVEHGPICEPTNKVEAREYEEGKIQADEVEDLSASGEAKAGEQETFEQNLNFRNCITYRPAGETKPGKKVVEEKLVVKRFTLGIVFHSNHAAQLGEPEAGATILKGSVVVHAKDAKCVVEIPEQYVPLKAGEERFKEAEFEAALYATEEEPTESKREKRLYGPVHDTLDIEAAFGKVKTEIEFINGCARRGKPEEEEEEYDHGVLEFELETGVKGGNLAFLPPV